MKTLLFCKYVLDNCGQSMLTATIWCDHGENCVLVAFVRTDRNFYLYIFLVCTSVVTHYVLGNIVHVIKYITVRICNQLLETHP